MNRRRFVGTASGLLVSGSGLAAGAPVRGRAGRAYSDNLQRLTEWVVSSVVHEGIELLPDLPSGRTRGGRDREDLKRLCWLQNCNLFGFHALREFAPEVARSLERSYREWYARAFPDVEERTENYLPLGRLPAVSPPEGKFYRTVVRKTEVNGFTIGAETYDPEQLGTIFDDDPRGLLKFGALGAHLRGDRRRAEAYFQKALALWDGVGFQTPRRTQHQAYCTRYLAYALIVERALHAKIPAAMRQAIEERLWATQEEDGGLWTNYLRDGSLPPFAKQTTEIGPLALLAYCEQLWP